MPISNQVGSRLPQFGVKQTFNTDENNDDEGDAENLSDEDGCDDHKTIGDQSSVCGRKKIIHQMSTKLPFSNVANRETENDDKSNTEISARVIAGLVPSQTNKTKALSREQEILYTQVLQS